MNYTYPVSTNFSFSRESICLFQSRHRCCHILPFPGWNISLNEEWQEKTEKCFFFFRLTLLLELCCCCGYLLSKHHHVSDGCDYLYSRSYNWNRKEESLLSSWVWVSCSPDFTFYSELTACRSREKAIHPFFPAFISPPQSYFFLTLFHGFFVSAKFILQVCACLMLFRCFSLALSSLGVVLSLWPLYYSFSLLPVNISQIVSAAIVSSCISAFLLLMLLSHCQCPQNSVRCRQVSSILGATVLVQTMSKYKSLKIR